MIGRERVALVVPTLNEEDAIGPALARVPRDLVDRIIVADGGSRDRTAERARQEGAEVLDAGRGYGRACLMGAERAADCGIIAYMDGDGADPVEGIGALLEPIAAGDQDFTIASRTRGRREPGSMSWHQVLAGRAAGFGVRALYGVSFTDMSAFRAIRRDALLELGMREMTYGWNLEMQMRAARSGLRILEVPLPYGRRTGGVSKVAGSLRGTLTAGSRIVRTFVEVARNAEARP
ncbi:MAG: glycosyltransferase family 2 protein [Methylobacteriaceae bacterium]|nr:glycosyltransferase family 2 protein [Methylobacteriaceae bacterium]